MLQRTMQLGSMARGLPRLPMLHQPAPCSRSLVQQPQLQQQHQQQQQHGMLRRPVQLRAYAGSNEGYESGSPGETAGGGQMKVFADFSVYKSKAAMQIKYIAPGWKQTAGSGYVLDRPGVLFMEMAPSRSSNPGERAYNWEAKKNFAFSALELGEILSQPNAAHAFYHDPRKGQQGEGNTVKNLKWDHKAGADGKASYFINLYVTEGGQKQEGLSISLTQGEFYVFKRLADEAIVRLLGFDYAWSNGLEN